MDLTDDQKKYINQNFTHTDEQLAKFLNVPIKAIEDYTKNLHDALMSVKEQYKSYLQYPNIIIELRSAIDILSIVSLPKFTTVSERSKCIEGIKNLITAADMGQIGEILLESLKRSANIDDNYNEVYQCINKWIIERRNDRDVVSPLNVIGNSNREAMNEYK